MYRPVSRLRPTRHPAPLSGAVLAVIVIGLAVLVTTACSDSAPSAPLIPLVAEACTEGEARDIKLYFKNLNDFEWKGIAFSVTRRGREYTWRRGGGDWLPESVKPSDPFARPIEWLRRRTRRFSVVGEGITSMSFFSDLSTARIQITGPFEAEWTGEVSECEEEEGVGRTGTAPPGWRRMA